MSKFGRAILNNALLSPAQTRSWMKPVTFTSSMNIAVGRPWEIYRVQSNGRVTDHYTKGGDIGVYSSLLSLIPDYNAGYSVFTADGHAADVAATLSEMVAMTFGHALQASAKVQAVGKFAGTYAAANGTNSTVVIDSSNTFGMAVQSWTSEGNNMLANIALTQGLPGPTGLLVLLVPTGLKSIDMSNGQTTMGFRLILGFDGPVPTNIFNLNCATWTTVDGLDYGGVSLDLFTFTVDETDQVVEMGIPVLQSTLKRVA
jgi:hypothetical protein